MTVVIDLQIAAEGSFPNEKQFQQWVESALQEVTQDCELSIRLVDESESTELNSTYRGKTGPTNVLSFPFDSPIPMEPKLLGDLIICVPVVKREALEQDKPIEHHWAHLTVHGCLHLLGYDHIEDDEAQQMESKEVVILQSLAISDPYQAQGEDK
ncbi:MAG: rRNA maturation RNase YbeY [Methylophagaceae bacterium]